MKVFIRTFGCQMNKLDSELISEKLSQEGHTQAKNPEGADIILFNTCSVRENAETRVYENLKALKKLKLKKPNLIIGLIGCMAEKDQTKALDHVPYLDLICGPNQENAIPEMIKEIRKTKSKVIRTGISPEQLQVDKRKSRPIQAYVKAMRGCDNFCSYCIVPYVRGREISRPIDQITKEIIQLAKTGTKEITLIGQNITSYGKRMANGKGLLELLHAVNDIDGIERIRFVTSHPAYTKDDVFYAMRDFPKVCAYLHMPAQSGSDKILKVMNRRYTRGDYLALIKKARKIAPDIEIVSDFIVGFPGETDKDFKDTVKLIKEAKFLNSFVFKYSTRPGTKAAKLKDNIPSKTKEKRNKILLEVQSQISKERNQKLIDKTLEILVEGKSKTNKKMQTGRARQNHIVVFESDKDLKGQLVKTKIISATALSLKGTLS